jgi:hypothetical protein
MLRGLIIVYLQQIDEFDFCTKFSGRTAALSLVARISDR